MRIPYAVVPAIAGSLLAVAAPVGTASAVSGGFAVTRVIVGGRVLAVAADPATGIVYAANSVVPGNSVAAIDAATNKVAATISVPMFVRDVAVDPATDTVYADGDSPAEVAVINGATDAVTTTISLSSNALPAATAVNPGTHTLYVADEVHGSVDVIDTANDTLTATIPLNAAVSSIAVDTATNELYVPDGNSMVTVIDGTSDKITHRIALPAGAFARGSAVGSGFVYVADLGSNAISVIDTATHTVSSTITGLAGITGVTLGPAGTLYAVAPEGGQFNIGTTYVIDTANAKVTAQIPRGGEWVAAVSGSAYLSNGYGALPGSVSVITPSSATTMCPVFLGPFNLRFAGGQASQVQLQASAIPAATFSATGMPAWLTLSPAGLLSGTPPKGPGLRGYNVTVTMANGISPPDIESVFIEVDQPPVITSAAHAIFKVGILGIFTVTAAGYPPRITFTEAGALPRGVTLSNAGKLSGTPARGTGGRYQITLTANNSVGAPGTQKFTLTVDQPPSFTSPGLVTFRVRTQKTFTIVTHGFPAAQLTESGTLPGGISFRPGPHGTATLSGKAFRRARGHTFRITITARNGVGPAVHQLLTIVVK